jgi:thiamine biosynthesis lipoprotein
MLSLAGTAALAGIGVWRHTKPHGWTDTRERITGSGWALGTHVLLTVYHADRELGEVAIREAFKELDAVESVLSLYRETSAISELNRTGLLESPHPWLKEILIMANGLSQATNGAFDVTIQPLYQAYAKASKNGLGQPHTEALTQALSKVDWRRVVLEDNRITLRGTGTQISLNGIAQGFAADRVAAVLLNHGIADALIDTGELGSMGSPTSRDAWNVGIKHPRRAGELLAGAELTGRCLATSGDYATRFSKDFSSHHLFSPATGLSANSLASVSVVADSAMEADGLSTALFVLGLEKAQAFMDSRPDLAALFVTKSGKVIPSQGFPLKG